jgi:hypothetical protein
MQWTLDGSAPAQRPKHWATLVLFCLSARILKATTRLRTIGICTDCVCIVYGGCRHTPHHSFVLCCIRWSGRVDRSQAAY